jgi:serine/threonine protein kinase
LISSGIFKRKSIIKIISGKFQDLPDVKASVHHEARVLEYLTKINWPRSPKYINRGINHHNYEQEEGEWPWVEMEFIPGRSVSEFIKEKLPLNSKLFIATEILDAIHDMHQCGVIHRDLSPGNLIFYKNTIRVIDFGSSRLMAHVDGVFHEYASNLPMHKDGYAAPELYDDYEKSGHSADAYAAGIILFELFTDGLKPFENRGEHKSTNRMKLVEMLRRKGVHEDIALFIGKRSLNFDHLERSSVKELKLMIKGVYDK